MSKRPKGMSYIAWHRAMVAARVRVQQEPDTHLVPNFASDFTPCGCATHQYTTILAVPVQWCSRKRGEQWRYHLRCLVCGRRWTWRVLPDDRRNEFGVGPAKVLVHWQLNVTASHPDVVRMRARRDRMRAEESFNRRHVEPGAARRERIKARALVMRANKRGT